MNPFKSDTAPYVATLLISALGWLLTTLHGEIRSIAVLAYQPRLTAGELTLEMRNISGVVAIKDAEISLICPKTASCVRPVGWSNGNPRYGSVARVQPTGDAPQVTSSDSTQISARISLPPGGRTRIVTPYDGQPPEFYYFQTTATPMQVVKLNSPRGLFIAHYGQLLGALFALVAGALGVWLVRNLFTRAPQEPKDEPPPLHVVLRLDDGDGR
jgi:hypothetical protein